MDSGRIELSDLSEFVARRDGDASFVAVAGRAETSAAPLWRAEIVIGSERATMPERAWQYEECTFVSTTLPISTVYNILDGNTSQQIQAASVTLEFTLNGHCNFQHKPSYAQYDNPQLSWPSWEYIPSLVQPPQQFQPPSGFLIGPISPSFVAFSAAFNAFFLDEFALSGTTNPSFGQVAIRLCDERGRIGAITIAPTHLEIEVDGNALEGTSLELMATTDRAMVAVSGAGIVHVPLPHGLPSDAWLWLRSDTEWYDYCSLGGYAAYRRADIRDERPSKPGADIAAMIAQGESEHVEFKGQLPSNSPASRRTALKTIVAFANTGGGTLLYGVDDDGLVCGLPTATQETVDGFINTLRASTAPMPSCRPFLHYFGDKRILVVEVEASQGSIYALTVDADKHEFFVRRGATTFRAQSGELEAIAKRDRRQQPLGILGMNLA